MLMQRDDSGFTLIELVIAFALMAVVVSVTYGGLTNILRSKEILDDIRDTQAIANSVITRMSRELQLADARSRLLPDQSSPEVRYSQRVCMIGVHQSLGIEGDSSDSISFMARGAGQYVLGNDSYSDVVKITYRLAEDPEQQPGAEGPVYLLIREETPAIRPIERAFARMMVFPVTNRLVSLSFRYRDPRPDQESWYHDWGEGEKVGLPAIIEFTVKIRSPHGKVETYTTAVAPHGSSDLD